MPFENAPTHSVCAHSEHTHVKGCLDFFRKFGKVQASLTYSEIESTQRALRDHLEDTHFTAGGLKTC